MQPRVPEAGAGDWLSRPQPRGRMAGDAASVGAEPSPPRTVTPGSCGPEIGRPSAGAFVPTSGSCPSAPPLRGGTPHTGPTAMRLSGSRRAQDSPAPPHAPPASPPQLRAIPSTCGAPCAAPPPAIRLGTCCSFCLRRSFLPKSSFASASFLLCFQVSAETSLLKIFQTLPSLPTERVRLCFAMVCHGRFAMVDVGHSCA